MWFFTQESDAGSGFLVDDVVAFGTIPARGDDPETLRIILSSGAFFNFTDADLRRRAIAAIKSHVGPVENGTLSRAEQSPQQTLQFT